jgi:hypothetical protein
MCNQSMCRHIRGGFSIQPTRANRGLAAWRLSVLASLPIAVFRACSQILLILLILSNTKSLHCDSASNRTSESMAARPDGPPDGSR